VKKIEIVRILLGLLLILFISVLLGSGRIEIKALQSLLFLIVLFYGNRYGAGMGAGCGTLCGILLTLATNNLAYIAVLCVGGMMAGFFSVLGRMGSVIAFLAGMVTISAIYSWELFTQSGWQVLASCVVYFLIPLSVMKQSGKSRKKHRGKETEIVLKKLNRMADSFYLLSNYFNDRNLMNQQSLTQMASASGAPIEWIEKYSDSQKAIHTQFFQMGRLMQDVANQMQGVKKVSVNQYKNLVRMLKLRQIYTKQIVFFEDSSGRNEVYMNLKTSKNNYVSAKDVVDCLNKETGKRWKIAIDCKNIINQSYAEMKFEEEPRYQVLHGIARVTKTGEEISGDSFSVKFLSGSRVLFCLSDGMGSGRNAYLESQMAVDLLEQLLETGFELEASVDFINHVLLFCQRQQHPTTLDICLLDLYTGQCELVKLGAPKSFLKRKNQTAMIGDFQVPLGMIQESSFQVQSMQLEDKDVYVMVTDGVLDQIESGTCEQEFLQLISNYSRINAKEGALWLMNQILPEGEEAKDDMTILIIGVHKR
jgi:stage II sporulation protein E